ncbi:MAG: hypothetical protein K8R69_04930 [Deltaproteobacteria bacterium]|nr:hypothetical protein [Deltaproteobacteria bacterium]
MAEESSGEKYPCATCGGILNFDPKSGKLKCPYCGAEQAVPDSPSTVEEHSFESFLVRVKTQDWGLKLSSIRCEACGATTQTNDKVTAMNCPFCNHPMVVGNEQVAEDAVRPESVLPFQVDKERLMEGFRTWLKSRWFAPSDLQKYWQKGKIRSMYLPYWTFDANTSTRWTAEAGYYYYVEENNERVRKVRWEPAAGSREDFFDDELLCASKGLAINLLNTRCPRGHRAQSANLSHLQRHQDQAYPAADLHWILRIQWKEFPFLRERADGKNRRANAAELGENTADGIVAIDPAGPLRRT